MYRLPGGRLDTGGARRASQEENPALGASRQSRRRYCAVGERRLRTSDKSPVFPDPRPQDGAIGTVFDALAVALAVAPRPDPLRAARDRIGAPATVDAIPELADIPFAVGKRVCGLAVEFAVPELADVPLAAGEREVALTVVSAVPERADIPRAVGKCHAALAVVRAIPKLAGVPHAAGERGFADAVGPGNTGSRRGARRRPALTSRCRRARGLLCALGRLFCRRPVRGRFL